MVNLTQMASRLAPTAPTPHPTPRPLPRSLRAGALLFRACWVLPLSLTNPMAGHYPNLFATTCDFPLLKKLAIHSFNTLNRLAADVVRFSEALPALEDLTLNTDYPFGHLTFLGPGYVDVNYTVVGGRPTKNPPIAFTRTHVSCWLAEAGIFAPDAPVVSIRSPIRALELHNCQQFVTDVLRSLTAPDLTSTIAAFLSRSAILDSPTHAVLWISTLAVFRPDFHAALEEASVLEMVASRRPVLRELRIQSPKLHPILSQAAVQMLGAEGMEVMLSEYEL
ncbi:hypothetical protein B0H13DRAFT_2680280 [Mycena leptocephala]|nr:hypothetical protein B0H13DRAFT_2680280 [Mycena leptocephala]